MAKTVTRNMNPLLPISEGSLSMAQSVAGSFIERTIETLDSIDLKMSVKGERYWDIKLYFAPEEEATALARLSTIDAGLRNRFGNQAKREVVVIPER